VIPVTVTEHEAFRASLENHAGDEIDIDAGDLNPPARRKDSEINRVLSIIDNLPTGKDAE
jgi:hypothetical protein